MHCCSYECLIVGCPTPYPLHVTFITHEFLRSSLTPTTGFTLGMNTDDLNAQCKDWGYAIGSKDCGYLFNLHNVTLTAQHTVIAKNNQSKLFACPASR